MFLPAHADHRGVLSGTLLFLVVCLALCYAVLSLPITQEYVWNNVYEPEERLKIIADKDITKSWTESLSFILDLAVAFLIGGSIFGEKLAKSFKESIQQYEKAREAVLNNEVNSLSGDIETTVKSSVEKVIEIRSGSTGDMIRHLPSLIKEMRNIYYLAFKGIPNFYKGYMRYVFYSSFPGGLYGLSAFILFFTSAGLKLVTMYLGSPYLIK